MAMSLSRREALTGIGSMVGGVLLPTVAIVPAAMATDKTKLIRYGSSRSFDVVHQMSLTNRDSRMRSFEIWLPIPLDLEEQSVDNLKIEPKVPVWMDKNGQARVARLLVDRRLPKIGETRALKLSYRVTRKTVIADIEKLDRLPYQAYKKDRNYALYTADEAKIEAHSAKIVEVAKKLKKNRRTAVAIARAAYEWVIDHTTYKLLDTVASATYCLEQGHGECTEYAALFVGLCRAAGVPARAVTGFRGSKANDWHAWAEFMLPDGRWIPVDPTQGEHNLYNRAISFGTADNRRIALCKTYDVRLKDVDKGQSESDFLQVGRYWWKWRAKKGKTKQLKSPDYKFQLDSEPAA